MAFSPATRYLCVLWVQAGKQRWQLQLKLCGDGNLLRNNGNFLSSHLWYWRLLNWWVPYINLLCYVILIITKYWKKHYLSDSLFYTKQHTFAPRCAIFKIIPSSVWVYFENKSNRKHCMHPDRYTLTVKTSENIFLKSAILFCCSFP